MAGIPKWMCSEYTDDGCSIYKCLFCKTSSEARSLPHKYCPFCGVKYDGELIKVEKEKVVVPLHPPRGKFPWEDIQWEYDHPVGLYIEDSIKMGVDWTKWVQKAFIKEYDMNDYRTGTTQSGVPVVARWLHMYRTQFDQQTDPNYQCRLKIDIPRYKQYLRALGGPKLPK